MNLKVHVKSKIQKPIQEVFDTIVDKNEITKYFVTDTDGDLVKGAKIKWEWKDFCAECTVDVLEVDENQRIVFEWKRNSVATKVEMLFNETEKNATELLIQESAYENNEEGIQKVMQQTQGWTDFICSLKAYLYTGINLRSGKVN